MALTKEQTLLGPTDDRYKNRAYYSPEFNPIAGTVEILNLCSSAQENCKGEIGTTNWENNSELERNGPLVGKTKVGNVGLEILVSPIEGKIFLTELDETKKNKIDEILSSENLPIGLKKIVKHEQINGNECITLDLLSVGQPKQALVDGLSRELFHLLGNEEIPNFDYRKISKEDQEKKIIETKFGTLKSNLSFLISRPGDADNPVWTQAAVAFREKSFKAKSVFGIIAEPSGRGKTMISRDIIKSFIDMESLSSEAFGGRRLSQEINETLLNNYYANDRIDDILIVSPEVNEESNFDFIKVMRDFKDICSNRTRGQTILVVDNAQFLNFPKSGDWLNEFEEFLNVLASRQDGSGVLVLAEHMPAGANESQFQGHRLERVELPFTADDFGLPKGTEKEVNENAVGFRLITRTLIDDPQSKTQREIADRLYPDRNNRAPSAFYEKYQKSFNTITRKIAKDLLLNEDIGILFQDKKISNFLSFSHISSVSKNLCASLNNALLDTTNQSWLSVGMDGSINVKDQSKLDSIVDMAARSLISKVTSLAEGKIAEEQERNNVNLPPAESSQVIQKIKDNIFDLISARRASLAEEEKELRERIVANTNEQKKLISISESLGDMSAENFKFITGHQPLMESLNFILAEKISPDNFNSVFDTLLSEKGELSQIFSHIGEIIGVEPNVNEALTNLGNTLSTISNISEWNKLSFITKILVETIKNSKFAKEYNSFYSNYQKALEYFSQK